MTNLFETAQQWAEDQYADDQFREPTLDSYKASLRMFARHPTTPTEIEDVTAEHVQMWRRSISLRINPQTGMRVKPASVYNRLTALKSFFRWAEREGLIEHDPIANIDMPKLREKGFQQRHLEPHEVRDALKGADKRTALFILLAVQLGMRRGEIARLATRDISWNEDRTSGWLKVVNGKGGRQRSLPLPEGQCTSALLEWIDGLDSNEVWVFPSAKGGHILPATVGANVSKQVKGHGRATHAFRHTAAVDVLREAHDVNKVRKMLGHANIQTTQHYLDQSTEDLLDVMSGRTY